MEVNILQSLTEYIAMMSCLMRLSQHQPVLKIYNVIGLILNFMCVLVCMHYYGIGTKICGYFCVMWYTKHLFEFMWKDVVKYFGLMLIVVSGLQLLLYILIGSWFLASYEMSTVGVIENCIIIVIFLIWKRRFTEAAMKVITWIKEGIYIIIFFCSFSTCFIFEMRKTL